MNKKFGILSSSTNPEQLGQTVKGIILGASTIILFVAGLLNIPFADADVVQLATQVGAAVSSLWILFGIGQKVVVAIYDRFFK